MRRYVEKEPLVAARVILSERPNAIACASVGLRFPWACLRPAPPCACSSAVLYAPQIACAWPLLSAYPGHVQRLGIICNGSSYPRSEEQVGAAVLGDTKARGCADRHCGGRWLAQRSLAQQVRLWY